MKRIRGLNSGKKDEPGHVLQVLSNIILFEAASGAPGDTEPKSFTGQIPTKTNSINRDP